MSSDGTDSHLPLKPAWFHILLTLAEEPAHGYAIRKAVESRTAGKLKLWPATLYGALSDLSEAEMIEERDPDTEAEDNLGKIVYGLTGFGEEVLEAETDRLAGLVDAARAARGMKPRTA